MFYDKTSFFKHLNNANDKALSLLEKAVSEPRKSKALISDIKSSIYEMREAFYNLMPEESPFYGNRETFQNEFNYLTEEIFKEDNFKKISTLLPETFQPEEISPNLLKKLEDSYNSLLCLLNPVLEGDFDIEEIKPGSDLRTPHDLVRYMHRVGTHFIFDPNGDKWGDYSWGHQYCEGGMKLRLVSADDVSAKDYFKKNIFLQRFKRIGDSEKFVTKGNTIDQFLTVIGKNTLSMQIPLGCHYAALRIDYNDKETEIDFKFTNTRTYRTSKFRTNVAVGILKSLGLNVDVKDSDYKYKKISVNQKYQDRKQALEMFEILLRFSVSMQDLDVMHDEKIEKRVGETIKAFKSGVINLKDYLLQGKPGTYEDYAKIKGTYLEGWKKSGKKKPEPELIPESESLERYASEESLIQQLREDSGYSGETLPEEQELISGLTQEIQGLGESSKEPESTLSIMDFLKEEYPPKFDLTKSSKKSLDSIIFPKENKSFLKTISEKLSHSLKSAFKIYPGPYESILSNSNLEKK